jgi:hypothetical protein
MTDPLGLLADVANDVARLALQDAPAAHEPIGADAERAQLRAQYVVNIARLQTLWHTNSQLQEEVAALRAHNNGVAGARPAPAGQM